MSIVIYKPPSILYLFMIRLILKSGSVTNIAKMIVPYHSSYTQRHSLRSRQFTVNGHKDGASDGEKGKKDEFENERKNEDAMWAKEIKATGKLAK